MKKKMQYNNQEERESLIQENSLLILVEEQNINEGNFLIFSDNPIEEKVVYTNVPEKDYELLKAQIQASSDRSDFHEDLIAELAIKVY